MDLLWSLKRKCCLDSWGGFAGEVRLVCFEGCGSRFSAGGFLKESSGSGSGSVRPKVGCFENLFSLNSTCLEADCRSICSMKLNGVEAGLAGSSWSSCESFGSGELGGELKVFGGGGAEKAEVRRFESVGWKPELIVSLVGEGLKFGSISSEKSMWSLWLL